jgi:hypothetical protein
MESNVMYECSEERIVVHLLRFLFQLHLFPSSLGISSRQFYDTTWQRVEMSAAILHSTCFIQLHQMAVLNQIQLRESQSY